MRILIVLAALILSGCAHRSQVEPRELRVLAYNIHHGAGLDGNLDLERIAQVIRSVQPDLVALQEVDNRTTRTKKVDQPTELGRLTGMHSVFGKAMDHQGGEYGQAILSRWPIASHVVHMLPQRPEREPRIVLAAKIRLPGGEMTFAGTHLDHEIEEIRIEQAQKLDEIFADDSTAILAGDFNAVPESGPMQSLFRNWLDAAAENPEPTIPAQEPRRRIDYILLRPTSGWSIIETRVLDEAVASDHRPVFAILRRNSN